jgi:cytochrome P450
MTGPEEIDQLEPQPMMNTKHLDTPAPLKTEDLPEFRFPLRREHLFAPPQSAQDIRARCPVSKVRLPNGGTAWLVAGYEEARWVLSHAAVSNDPSRPGAPVVTGERKQYRKEPGFFVDSDAPEHTRLRSMLVGEFNVKRINNMRSGIQRNAETLIDAMLAGGNCTDIVESLALPLACMTICQLLGAPADDHRFLQHIRKSLVNVEAPANERKEAFTQLHDYLIRLVDQRRTEPADDLIGRLVENQFNQGRLTHEELTGMTMLLLFTGFETAANMIAVGLAALLHFEDQRRLLEADPALLPSAVEEMLRYYSTAALEMAGRSATAEMEVGGVRVMPGEGLIIQPWLANHDERVMEDPDSFRITRGFRRHLSFGFGPHQCLGQNLVRAQMEIAIGTVLRRIPGMELECAAEELELSSQSAAFGLTVLPVRW